MFEKIFDYFVRDFRGAFGLIGEILRDNVPQWNIQPTKEEVTAIHQMDDPLNWFFHKGMLAHIGFTHEPTDEEIEEREAKITEINRITDEEFVKARRMARTTLIGWSNFINNYVGENDVPQATSVSSDDRSLDPLEEGQTEDELCSDESVHCTTD